MIRYQSRDIDIVSCLSYFILSTSSKCIWAKLCGYWSDALQLYHVFQPRFYSRYMLIGEALAIVCRLHNNRRPFRPFLRIDDRHIKGRLRLQLRMINAMHCAADTSLHSSLGRMYVKSFVKFYTRKIQVVIFIVTTILIALFSSVDIWRRKIRRRHGEWWKKDEASLRCQKPEERDKASENERTMRMDQYR